MSDINSNDAQSAVTAEVVRDLWLVDRQQPTPKPMGMWIVEHEELHEEIVSWEILYRHHGAEAFVELKALETVFERRLGPTGLNTDEQPAATDGNATPSLSAAIEAAGLKPGDIARKLHVGTTVIARLMRGQIDPLTAPVPFLVSFSHAVNTKVDTLIEMLRFPHLTPHAAMYKRESRGVTSVVAEPGVEYHASQGASGTPADPRTAQEQHVTGGTGNGATRATMAFYDAIASAPDMTDDEKKQWLSG